MACTQSIPAVWLAVVGLLLIACARTPEPVPLSSEAVGPIVPADTPAAVIADSRTGSLPAKQAASPPTAPGSLTGIALPERTAPFMSLEPYRPRSPDQAMPLADHPAIDHRLRAADGQPNDDDVGPGPRRPGSAMRVQPLWRDGVSPYAPALPDSASAASWDDLPATVPPGHPAHQAAPSPRPPQPVPTGSIVGALIAAQP